MEHVITIQYGWCKTVQTQLQCFNCQRNIKRGCSPNRTLHRDWTVIKHQNMFWINFPTWKCTHKINKCYTCGRVTGIDNKYLVIWYSLSLLVVLLILTAKGQPIHQLNIEIRSKANIINQFWREWWGHRLSIPEHFWNNQNRFDISHWQARDWLQIGHSDS